jgi:hypothetical protein
MLSYRGWVVKFLLTLFHMFNIKLIYFMPRVAGPKTLCYGASTKRAAFEKGLPPENGKGIELA